MVSRVLYRRLSVGLVGAGLVAAACSSDTVDPVCPAPQPAFNVSLRAMSGALPADTALAARYGGGAETHALNQPDEPHESLLCTALDEEGAAITKEGETVYSLDCELWSQGAVQITVTAMGYPDLEQQLSAETGACDAIVTVDEELVLLPEADAGS